MSAAFMGVESRWTRRHLDVVDKRMILLQAPEFAPEMLSARWSLLKEKLCTSPRVEGRPLKNADHPA